jgi:hypothetical protein
MNTNDHNAPQATVDETALDAELRARVPGWMKSGVEAVAKPRVLQNPDILREAVAEYLERRGIKPPAAHTQPTEKAA